MSPLGEDSGSAAALAEKILTICERGDRVIFFKGNLAKDTMCEVLENGGLLVEQLVVYETKESCDLKKDLAVLQPPHWVVLFSPSGARAALPLLPEEMSFKLVAIGETVGFGQDPISLQGQPQETRCCVWASTLQELHLNLHLRVCCQCSEAALQTEDISKFLLRTSACPIPSSQYLFITKCYISDFDLLTFHNEESEGKGSSGPELIAGLWLCMQALQVFNQCLFYWPCLPNCHNCR